MRHLSPSSVTCYWNGLLTLKGKICFEMKVVSSETETLAFM